MSERCTVRLTAVRGTPLEHSRVRSMVEAAARALAEREGVRVEALEMTPESITLTLGLGRLGAVGFLAELRRTTNAWYEGKFKHGPLWVSGE